VADSNPEAEYEETIAKARGFLSALNLPAALGVARGISGKLSG
jgi:anthranilate/para-aminobenzoate synthase component I